MDTLIANNPFKTKTIPSNKPKKLVFSDSEDEDKKTANNKTFTTLGPKNINDNDKKVKRTLDLDFDDNNSETNEDKFNNAINNKLYHGKQGRMLFELQQAGKGDKRFQFKSQFKDEINLDRVSKNLKSRTDAFDYKESNKNKNITSLSKSKHNQQDGDKKSKVYEIINSETLLKEKNNNLALLSTITSNTEFFDHKINKRQVRPHVLITKRFDPIIGLGEELKREDLKNKNTNEITNIVKLNKGFEKLGKIETENDSKVKSYFNKTKNILSKKELRDKDKELSNIINEIQEKDMKEVKVEVNLDFFRNITQNKSSSNKDKEEADRINDLFSTANNVSVANNNNKNDDNNNSDDDGDEEEEELALKEYLKKDSLIKESRLKEIKIKEAKEKNTLEEFELGNPDKNIEREKKREKLLERKRERIEIKEKEKEKKMKKELREDNKLKRVLLQENDANKVDNYLRMIKLVSGVRKIK